MDKETILIKHAETKIVQDLRPTIRQYWLIFAVIAFSVFLAFRAFGINTVTGLSILSVSGILIVHIMLSIYTTRYLITQGGILIRNGPFTKRFKEIHYCDINNITVRQGRMQKRFRIGHLIISAGRVTCTLRGIKNPQKTKEVINQEKAFEYERRTLFRKIL